MTHPKKIRVAVLYGGRSGEHEVSLMSATNVIQYLDREHYEVVPIGIDKKGIWFLGDDAFKELTNKTPLRLSQEEERMLFSPELIGKHMQPINPTQLMPNTNSNQRMFDVIFPAIHGPLCEDGTIQGLLELADVPYVGCGVLSSAIGMDKDVSKRLVKASGINVTPYITAKIGQWEKNPDQICKAALDKLKFPLFVKPANTGSSVGIEKVKKTEDLKSAIANAFQYDNKILIEQGVDGLELEVAVLESLDAGADPIVSVVGEIKPRHEFYSYQAKYLDENGAELLIPASISNDLQEKVRLAAKNIFNALECEGMARVDLFLDRNSNQIYFNEVNTIPGFTQISMYPKMMAASGISYPELLSHLVKLALHRQERKNHIQREYVNA